MKKKILSLLLCLAMIFSLTLNVSAASVSDFSDVSQSSWYYSSVKFVTDQGYMNGTSATTFSPSDEMTRAMFVTVLSREAKAEVDNNVESSFTDVQQGQWYTGVVEWAHNNGIVTGYSDMLFGIDDPITRQDIAVLVDRYVKFMNYTLKQKPQVESFIDEADISDYAKSAVEACRLAGLYYGHPDGKLCPKEYVTRAEVAAIIERLEKITSAGTKDAPVISPNGGSFSGTRTVTITTDIEGAVIYYTTDGSDPTTSSTLYTGPFTLNNSATVKAVAVVDGQIVSKIASASFTKVSGGSGGTATMYTVPVYDASGKPTGDTYKGSAVTAERAAEKLALADPTKESTVDKDYTFAGWAWFDANGNQTNDISKAAALKPVFEESVRKYTVTWVNAADGSVCGSGEYEYGAVPSYADIPQIDGMIWTALDPKELTAVTGDATYRVTYKNIEASVTVTWYDDDGVTVLYGPLTITDQTIPTQPEPVKDGYLFTGWRYSENSTDTNIIYIAEYKPASMDYSVTLTLGKGSRNYEIIAVDENAPRSPHYHVVYDKNGNIVESESDDISLVQVAKDLCDRENLEAILEKLSNLSIMDDGTEKFVVKDGAVQEIVVQTIVVDKVVEAKDRQAVMDEINQAIASESIKDENGNPITEPIDQKVIDDIIKVLDEGITEDNTLSELEITIAGALADKLQEKIDTEPAAFEQKLKDLLQDYLGFDSMDEVDSFLVNLGITEENGVTLTTFAQEYIDKLNTIVENSGGSARLTAQDTANLTTEEGVEIKVNPVTVLIQQYGTADDSYAAAWDLLAGYIGEDRRDELKGSLSGQALIAACDPARFFDRTTDESGKAVYSLKTDAEYDSLFCDVIDKAEAVRQDLIVGKDQSEIEDLIRTVSEKADGKLGSTFITDSLSDSRVADLARLLGMSEPRLTDISNVKEQGLSKSKSVTVGGSEADIDVDTIVKTVMDAIGVEEENFDKAQGLIDGIKSKLSGTYTISIEISADPCDKTQTH